MTSRRACFRVHGGAASDISQTFECASAREGVRETRERESAGGSAGGSVQRAASIVVDTSNGQVADVNEKVVTMSKTMQSPSSVRSADASASAVSEDWLNRLERVEDDVSTLIGVRDSNKIAWSEVRLATRFRLGLRV